MTAVNPDEYLGGGWVDVRSGLPTDKSDERVKGRGCGFGVAVISKCGGLVQQAVKGFRNSRVGYQALANELEVPPVAVPLPMLDPEPSVVPGVGAS